MKSFLKKSLAAFSAFLTAGLLVTSNLQVSAAELRNGDTNGDGKVDLYDAINISSYLLGRFEFEGNNAEQADYNKDGKVDLYDAVFVSRLILSEKKINEVIALVNMKRNISGVEPVTVDQKLVDAAMKRAYELTKDFSGDYRPDGSKFTTVLTEYGIVFEISETIVAAVPATPNDLYEAIVESDERLATLINGDYTKIGVGYCGMNDKYKHYWAILFI